MSRKPSRKLRATTLATVLAAALLAPAADAGPRERPDGATRWSRLVRAVSVLFAGLWDGYGGYVDPYGNNGDGDGEGGGG